MNAVELYDMFVAPGASTAQIAMQSVELVTVQIAALRSNYPDGIDMTSEEIALAIVEYARDSLLEED